MYSFFIKTAGCVAFVYHRVVDTFFPPICYGCFLYLPEHAIVCDACDKKLKPVVSFRIALTPSVGVPVYAAGTYEGFVRTMILSKGRSDVSASRQLGKLILKKTPITKFNFDAVVPIPLHWRRYARRGYNQAHIMATVLSASINVPVVNAITRLVNTTYQAKLGQVQRHKNVASAFRLKKGVDLKGKHVLIVDDLLTTGATVKSAAKLLAQLKPASLTVVVGARAV